MIDELDYRKRPRKASKQDNIKLMRALNYTKVLTPKNMKSEVWGYFGFPGNSNNEIVTKNVLICTICYVMFRNNRNTTNLRMHLERVHKVDLTLSRENSKNQDMFENMPDFYAASPAPTLKIKQARPKMKSFNASELPDYTNEDEITFDPLMENSMDVENTIYPQDQETTYEIMKPKEETDDYIRPGTNPMATSSRSANIVVSYQKPVIVDETPDITSSICNMIITDLMSTSCVEREGFHKFLQTVTRCNNIPTKDVIENNIRLLYNNKSADLIYEMKFLSTKNPFSLSYEIWENIENSVFITFYYHYLATENCKEILKEVMLKTIKLTSYTNLEEFFNGFNMKNCTAVIAAYGTDITELYFSKLNIPILPCFECVIKNSLGKVFSLSSVESVYLEVKETMQEFLSNHEIETPPESRQLPWAKLNALKFFVENIVWPEDSNNDLLSKSRIILETISPLKVAMESLAEESDPINSISKPLAMQLIDNNFRTHEDDLQLVTEIKETIYFELANNLLSNENFSVSAFLDPRFLQYLGDDCLPTVTNHLTIKATDLNLLTCSRGNFNESCSMSNSLVENSNHKKGLKVLFGSKEIANKRILPTNDNLDADIKKYVHDANADLDDSPLDWWNRYGYMYGNLKKLANLYNSIPCLCNKISLKPIETQLEIEDKKLNLKGNLINEILFLNYNFTF